MRTTTNFPLFKPKKLLKIATLFLVIIWTVGQSAPELTAFDAGELGAAAHELGIAHPPGYLIFVICHKAISLLPLGDIAQRQNWASAIVGWLALFFGVKLCNRLSINNFWAYSGLGLAFLTPLWSLHAGSIEVYTGVLVFMAALLLLSFDCDCRSFWALGFLSGLTLGHHAELRLFALIAALPAAWHYRTQPKKLLIFIALASTGALIVIDLPLRSLHFPMRDWGHPASVQALFDHLSASRIRLAYQDQMGFHFQNLRLFATQIIQQNGALFILGSVGLASLFFQKGKAKLIAFFALADAAYAVCINPMGLRDQQNGLPLVFCLGLGAAIAGQKLSQKIRHFSVPLVLGCILPLIWTEWPKFDAHIPRILNAISTEAPSESILFVTSDHLASGFAFAQTVEGARPDLAVLVRQHAWDPSSFGPVKRRLPEALRGWTANDGLHFLEILQQSKWPLLWEWANDNAWKPPLIANQPLPSYNLLFNKNNELQDLIQQSTSSEQDLLALLLDGQGQAALAHQQLPLAVQKMSAAVQRNPLNPTRWVHLASVYSATGQLEAAQQANQQALLLDKHHLAALHNQARFALLSQNIVAFQKAIEACPEDAERLTLEGIFLAQKGRFKEAKRLFLRSLELNPNDAETKTALSQVEALFSEAQQD